MGDMAADMTDEDLRIALVRLVCERWPDADADEVASRVEHIADAAGRAEVLPSDDGLPYWFEEWWGEVSGGAPTTS
jgi:hypothetical protein